MAVAKAAMESGVAQEPVDLHVYREQLGRRLGTAHEVTRMMIHKAQAHPKQVVFPDGDNEKILRACHALVEEKIASPIVLGDAANIRNIIAELGLDMNGVKIVDPATSPQREQYIQELFRLRQRGGMTLRKAKIQIANRNVFGSMMLHTGDADALVSGVTQHFPDTIRPARSLASAKAYIKFPAAMR